jgi:hypothetical protein
VVKMLAASLTKRKTLTIRRGKTVQKARLGDTLSEFFRAWQRGPLDVVAEVVGLLRRWGATKYDAPHFLRPQPVAKVLGRVWQEYEDLYRTARWVLLGDVGNVVVAVRVDSRGIPREIVTGRTRGWVRVQPVLRSAEDLSVQLREELMADRPPLWEWRRKKAKVWTEDAYRGDFFGFLWWELEAAIRLRLPARYCPACGVLFIAGYGNERYCPSHRRGSIYVQMHRARTKSATTRPTEA